MPLADFYSIKPYANRGPLDFWIRLNTAEQHLVSEGRTLPNQCSELAVMYATVLIKRWLKCSKANPFMTGQPVRYRIV
jgi:hypothetical protein